MRRIVYGLLLLLNVSTTTCQNVDCGMRDAKWDYARIRNRRIIGGNEVPVGKYPWHVQINATYHGVENDVLCGGSIIANRWILTAAHCFDDIAHLTYVVFGSVKRDEIREHRIVHPKNFIVYDKYDKKKNTNDIALVELENPIPFDDTVSSVCLPSKTTTIPEEAQVVATGIGYYNNRPSRNTIELGSPVLLETVFPLIPQDVCGLRKNSTIPDTLICGGSYGHGSAPGDSGGPLVIYSKSGRWFQVGVVSIGVQNIERDMNPGGYTNVQKYCDWIEETTRGEAKCQDAELIDATAAS